MSEADHNLSSGDTIVALSTARGLGAVAVVRLSGPIAWEIARKMVAERQRFASLAVRNMALFDLISSSGERIDRALAVKFASPASYTGENIVEFHCHGGLAVSSAVIDSARERGARNATAGEFTRRAFLNGRLDLTQAEAVDNLVHARTEEGRKAALSGLDGELGKQVETMRASLIAIRTELEYRIDFPEEAGSELPPERLDSLIEDSLTTLEKLLDGADRALIASRGALVVIAGSPNVGKSSLFNCLLGSKRAIVTASPGTTRDAVESELVVGGHLLRLVDTAGLRSSSNEAEKIGVEYSRHYIAGSDVVVFVHEAGSDFRQAERDFLAEHGDVPLVRVLSKVDIHPSSGSESEGYIPVSSKSGEGISELKKALASAVESAAGKESNSGSAVTSIRQKKLLEEARDLLRSIERSNPAELVAADIGQVCSRLDEITGRIATDDVLDSIFSRFCIGK